MSRYKTYYSTEELDESQIVIGISALNEQNTILNVVNTVQDGLMSYFPQYDSTIVIAAGDPEDKTVEMASSVRLPDNIGMKIIDEDGEGKGEAIQALMQVSQELDANMLTLLDGDLISIKPIWLAHLIEPIRYGIADFVSPRYLRGKHDGGITKMFSYPLISTLFGKEIRQPIGGEMALDSEFVETCLEKDYIPGKFGIDTFLTFTALSEGFRIAQAPLGARFHASTGEYEDPLALLGPMFSQVSGTTFRLIDENRDKIEMRCEREIYRNKFRKFDNYKGIFPTTPEVDTELFWKKGEEILSQNQDEMERYLGEKDWLNHFNKRKTLVSEDWSEIVFRLLAGYLHDPDKCLEILRAFWYGRYASFIEETGSLTLQETEEKVYENFKQFWDNRDLLIEGLHGT